jgi:hypothetical protein
MRNRITEARVGDLWEKNGQVVALSAPAYNGFPGTLNEQALGWSQSGFRPVIVVPVENGLRVVVENGSVVSYSNVPVEVPNDQ